MFEKVNISSFDSTIVGIDITSSLNLIDRDKLMNIIDDNDKLPGVGLMLEKMITLLKKEHGIKVELVHHPITVQDEIASWNGGILKVDVRKRGSLGSLFLLSHVFGHLIQYSSEVDYSSLLSFIKGKTPPIDLTEDFKEEYFIFENEAFEFGKTIMEESFEVNDELGILYSSFAYTDFEHYWRYLVTSQKSSKDEFNTVWKNFVNGGINNVISGTPLPNIFDKSKNEGLSITVI